MKLRETKEFDLFEWKGSLIGTPCIVKHDFSDPFDVNSEIGSQALKSIWRCVKQSTNFCLPFLPLLCGNNWELNLTFRNANLWNDKVETASLLLLEVEPTSLRHANEEEASVKYSEVRERSNAYSRGFNLQDT